MKAPLRVVFEVEALGDQVKVTVTHDGFEAGSKVFEAISQGWPHVLSSSEEFTWSRKGSYHAGALVPR